MPTLAEERDDLDYEEGVTEEQLDDLPLELDPESSAFVHHLVTKILLFVDELAGHALFPYQREFAYRFIESVVINDGEEITACYARQSGKTETVADVVAALMILLPKLATMKPFDVWLSKFANGVWIGTFAPVESQAETLFGRIVARLTSERALDIMNDPEIDDAPLGGGKLIRLKKSGSFARMQTANPKASIESKSYHIIIIDEAQRADERTVRKSIHPMGAFYNACLTGDARVLLADGSLVAIEDLVRKAQPTSVMAVEDEDLRTIRLVPREVVAFHDNGIRPCVRIDLRGGRSVTSTLNHHFVRVHNVRRNQWAWTAAEELGPGDRIAVPWQPVETGTPVDGPLPELIGWLIAEGSLTRTSIGMAVSVPHLIADVARLVEQWGSDVKWVHDGDRAGRITHVEGRRAACGGVGVGTGPKLNSLQLRLQELGLWGKSAFDKRIPQECFGWDNRALARLLSRMYAGDGCLHNGVVPVLKYTTVCRGLADDVQAVLDRLGVYSTIGQIRYHTPKGRPGVAWEVYVSDPVSQQRFLDQVGWMKSCNDYDGFVAKLGRRSKFRTDIGMRFETVKAVVSVGEHPTYDLQVAGSHNYVANGVISHNTIIKTGTPDVTKGDFYKAIRHNKRRQTRRGMRQCHFEHDWRSCAKYNQNYARFIKKEIARIGADSDEFQLSYALKWLLERGMFTTSERIDELGDRSMQIVKAYHGSPVVFGLDVARKLDSTVLTAIWVDWSRPDEFGYYDHRILNWLELHGDQWEEQYGQIVDFCRHYSGVKLGIDAQGIGDVVADRLSRLMPELEIVSYGSNTSDQSARWKHLSELIGRGMVSWPAHAKTRRLRTWRRFETQMKDLEKKYQGKFLLAAAPQEAEAHDDYPDSLALGCYLTRDWTLPEVEMTNSPFFRRSA